MILTDGDIILYVDKTLKIHRGNEMISGEGVGDNIIETTMK